MGYQSNLSMAQQPYRLTAMRSQYLTRKVKFITNDLILYVCKESYKNDLAFDSSVFNSPNFGEKAWDYTLNYVLFLSTVYKDYLKCKITLDAIKVDDFNEIFFEEIGYRQILNSVPSWKTPQVQWLIRSELDRINSYFLSLSSFPFLAPQISKQSLLSCDIQGVEGQIQSVSVADDLDNSKNVRKTIDDIIRKVEYGAQNIRVDMRGENIEVSLPLISRMLLERFCLNVVIAGASYQLISKIENYVLVELGKIATPALVAGFVCTSDYGESDEKMIELVAFKI